MTEWDSSDWYYSDDDDYETSYSYAAAVEDGLTVDNHTNKRMQHWHNAFEYSNGPAELEAGIKHKYMPWRTMTRTYFDEILRLKLEERMTDRHIQSYLRHHPNKRLRCNMSLATIHRFVTDEQKVRRLYGNSGIYINGEYILPWRDREKYEVKMSEQQKVKQVRGPGKPSKSEYDHLIRKWFIEEGLNTNQIYERFRKKGYPIGRTTVYEKIRELKRKENIITVHSEQEKQLLEQANGMVDEIAQLRGQVAQLTQVVLEVLNQKE